MCHGFGSIANLYIEHFEQLAITSAPVCPSIWYRYTDDKFIKINCDTVRTFTHHINNIDDNIKFTCDPEKDCQLPFLDTLITKKPNSSIKVLVYRKATHTYQYLDFQSHHPLEHQISVILTLMHRAETTVTEPSDLGVEKENIKSALKNCGYQNWVFSNSDRKSECTPEVNQRELTGRRIYSTLPYIQGISDKIRKAYKKEGVHTSFKPHKILHQLLVVPKDKPPNQLAGTVYCLECEDCHKCYIGESARPLGKRIKDHITTRSSSTSAVSEHLKTAKYHFDSDKVKILAREPKDFSRKILEAIHIRKEKPALNIETRGWIWIPYGIQFLWINCIYATSGRKRRHHQPTVSKDQSLHL